jgi:hypothetical protein
MRSFVVFCVAVLGVPAALMAAPVQFDLSGAVDRDVVYETGGGALPFGQNTNAVQSFGEAGGMDGLPTDRQVKSSDPELGTYLLRPYDGPNVVELNSASNSPDEEHVIEVPNHRYGKLGLLVTAVDGDASFTIKLTYTDGTTDTQWFEADDWYDLGPRGNLKKAVRDMDRVNTKTGKVEDSNHFNVYEFIMDGTRGLNTDRVLTSVTIGNVPNRWPADTAHYGGVFAINGAPAD